MASNNPPDVIVELTAEQAQFVLRNCDANDRYGMQQIIALADDPSAESAVRTLIEMREQFKQIKKAVERGLRQ